jgi:hypothetical protein
MILGSGSCALDKWQDHIVYVKFDCDCHKYSSMRVARLGDAITPLEFVSIKEARKLGRRPDVINAERTAHAIRYLAEHAAGTRMDYLTNTVYKLAAGSLAPEAALRQIYECIQNERSFDRFGAETLSPSTIYNGYVKTHNKTALFRVPDHIMSPDAQVTI